MDRILITGNLGYNGVWVTRALNQVGCHTIGFDIGYYQDEFFDYNQFLPHTQILEDIRTVQEKDLDGVDAVVHLAALSNDATGELNPELTFQINRDSTIKLARLAKEAGAKKFIYASSCSVYGICDSSLYANEESPLDPLTAYAKAKVEAETELACLHDESFKVVIMRNATMHGLSPKLRLDLVVNNLVAYSHLHNSVKILSDGTPWRPLLSVVDFAQAVLILLQNRPSRIIYNIGSNDENYQIITLGQIISEITGAKLEINPNETPDERSYRVDFTNFESEFPNFTIKMSVKDSIIELVQAYKQHNLTETDFSGSKYFRIRTLKNLLELGIIDKNLCKKRVSNEC